MKLHFIGGPMHEQVKDSSEYRDFWDGWSPISCTEPRDFSIADFKVDRPIDYEPIPIYSYRRVDLTSGVVLMVLERYDYSDEQAAELYRIGPVPAWDKPGARAWNRELNERFLKGERCLPPRAEHFDYEQSARQQTYRWKRPIR